MKLVPFAAALIALMLTAAACGDDDDGGDATPAATQTRAAASTPTQPSDTAEPAGTATTAQPSSDALDVSAADFAFSPDTLTVDGANDTTITLSNTGNAPHSMKVYRDSGYSEDVPGAETESVSAGGSDEFTLTSTNIGGASELFFRCEVHPSQMEGTITVE